MNSCIKALNGTKQIVLFSFLALLILSMGYNFVSASSTTRQMAILGSFLEPHLDVDARERVQVFSLFEKAFQERNLVQVNALIQQGKDVDSLALGGIPVLHSAVLCNFGEGIELLLEHGADINKRDVLKQETALHVAAHFGYYIPATLLITGGASIDAVDCKGMSPLTRAAWQQHEEIVNLLIDSGAVINHFDSLRATPLHWAVIKSYSAALKRIVTRLIRAGALINTPDKDGMTPLCWAVEKKRKKLFSI